MDGVGAVLKAAGLGYQHLVKCHVYLANMDDYAAMNAAYGSYFTDRVPARTTVQAAACRLGAGVEIACIAYADLAGISVVRPPPGSLPAPLGPYSPAVWAGDTLYVSGMGGQDPATKTVGEAVEAQVTQTVANITTTLKAAGLGAVRRRVGAGLCHAPRRGGRARRRRLAKAIDSPRGLVVVPRLPGPIRAELTFIATRPSAAGVNFGTAGTSGSIRGVRRDRRSTSTRCRDRRGRRRAGQAGVHGGSAAVLKTGGVGLAGRRHGDGVLSATSPICRGSTPSSRKRSRPIRRRVSPSRCSRRRKERIRVGLIAARVRSTGRCQETNDVDPTHVLRAPVHAAAGRRLHRRGRALGGGRRARGWPATTSRSSASGRSSTPPAPSPT